MNHSALGGLADVEYPAHFHRETMPAWLVAVLTALGRRAPDLRRPFTWLDLGCGAGLGALVGAATHPLGRFVGIDADPRAIERAQAVASAAGLDNVRFECLDFDTLAARTDALPGPCDFIVSHGVYSWVAPERRRAMRRIVERCLVPGGVACLGYMSQPGGASFAAARRLMTLAGQGDAVARVPAGLALLQALADGGAGYFTEHPTALRELQRLHAEDARQLAHEFLGSHWDALHVADVMAEFAAAGCQWAGSATPLENIDAVSLPAASQPLLAKLQREGADAALLETARDLARNQTLRRDLFLRAHREGNLLGDDRHRAALLAQRVCLTPQAPVAPPPRGELRLDTRIGPVTLPMALVAPLLAALHDGVASYADIARAPAFAARPGVLSVLLQTLAWAGWLQFVRPDWPAAGSAIEMRRAAALEEALAREPGLAGRWRVAPAIGSALPDAPAAPVSRLAALGCRAR